VLLTILHRYCFNELAKRQGTLQEAEFAVLAEWYKWLGERIDLSLDLIVYLRTSPDTVFNRMKGRGRAEESTVPFSYLSDLHDVYEDWLVNNSIVEESSHYHKKNKVIIIDANQSKEDVAQQCRLKIQEFLSELRNDEV
jgi:deoxyadenosine/deoxycytidine kinase